MTTPARGGDPLTLALPMPDEKSSYILAGMTLALVVFIWWLVRAIRRQGGFKPACRRLAWEVRMTRRAFTQPFRSRGLHRRRVRALTSFLADPAVPALVDHALTGVEQRAGQGCYAPALTVSADRRRVSVVVAGRSPRPPIAPWWEAGREPGDWTWTADAAALAPTARDPLARATLPLVLGVDRLTGGTVVADWLRGPAAVSLEGDTRMVRGLLQTLAAQLDLLAGGPVVEVARGVHPRYPGRDFDTILGELEYETAYGPGDGAAARPVVLVCWTPTLEQRRRLAALCAGGRVRTLVGGRLAGNCWSLHIEPGGRLLGPGLGIDVEAAALGTAVGTGIKRFRRRPAGWWTARPEPAEPGAESFHPMGPGDGGGSGGGPGAAGYGSSVLPPRMRNREPDPVWNQDPEPAAGVGTPSPTSTFNAFTPPEPPSPHGDDFNERGTEPIRPASTENSPAPAPVTPQPYADDFAEPATLTTPLPVLAPAPDPWPGPEPEPEPEPEGTHRHATAARPATGVSAASRTHSERTPEHP